MPNLCTTECRPVCNIAHERIALERRIIRRFIREAKKDGWTPATVNTGEHDEYVKTETETLEHVFSVDESVIWFRNPTIKVLSPLIIVLGNGIDCLVDSGKSIEHIYNAVFEYFETA